MGMKIEDLPPAFRAANAHILGEKVGILPLTKDDILKESEQKSAGNERGLQDKCESLLKERLYMRLTPINAADDCIGIAGWFGHLHKPIGNPFYADLAIYNYKMTRCLMVELKVKDSYQVGQQEMIMRGCWKLAKSVEEFRKILDKWESEVQDAEVQVGK